MSVLALAGDYYTEPRVYGMRPKPKREWNMGPIGPTGIFARIYKGMRVKVEKIEPGTPAAGKFKKGDLLLGVLSAYMHWANGLADLKDVEAVTNLLTVIGENIHELGLQPNPWTRREP